MRNIKKNNTCLLIIKCVYRGTGFRRWFERNRGAIT